MQSNTKIDHKIVLLGGSQVGKSSIISRFVHNKFSEQINVTIGSAFALQKIWFKGKQLSLGVWDTAGQERFRCMLPIYYRDASAAVVVYDLNSEKSWESLEYWLGELAKNAPSCQIVIVGNKADTVPNRGAGSELESKAKEAADDRGGHSVITSAKDNFNINKIFQLAVSLIHGEETFDETLFKEGDSGSNSGSNPTGGKRGSIVTALAAAASSEGAPRRSSVVKVHKEDSPASSSKQCAC